MTAKLNNNKINKPLKIVNKSKVLKKVTTKVQKLHGNEDTKKAAKFGVKIVAKSLKTAEVTEPNPVLTKKVKPLKEDALNKVHKPSIEADDNLMRVNTLNKTIKDATYELVKMGFKLDLPNLVKDDDFNKIKLSHKSKPRSRNNAHKRYGTESNRKNEFNKIKVSHQSKPFRKNDSKPYFSKFSNNKQRKIAFMRVNTLVKSIEDATAEIVKMGFVHVKEVYTTYEEYIAALRNLKPNEFIMDFNVKNLIAFNEEAKNLLSNIDVSTGIWFESKPYCLAILFLELQPGSIVLNMGPFRFGIIQIANEMKSNCTIYSAVTSKCGPNNIIEAVQNFPCIISVSEDMLSYRNKMVEYIFLDIRDRTSIAEEYLFHALTQFPNVKRIVVFGRGLKDVTKNVLLPCLRKVKNNFKLIDASKILKNTLLKNENGWVIISSEHDLCERSYIAVIDRCSKITTGKEFAASDDKGEIEDDDEEEASDDEHVQASDNDEVEASDDLNSDDNEEGEDVQASDNEEVEASDDLNSEDEEEASDDEDLQTSDNEELKANSNDNNEKLLKLISKKKSSKSVKSNQKPESISGSSKYVKNNTSKKNNSNNITEANNRLSKKPVKKNNVAEVVKRKIKNSGEHASKKLKK